MLFRSVSQSRYPFVVHVIFGVLAAILGIRTGRLVQSGHKVFLEAQGEDNVIKKSGSLPFNYAIEWLGLNVLLMIVGFLTINFLSFYWWVPTIGLIVTLWASRYKSALRQLTKPKFWIFFVIITMLSALVFSSFQEGSDAIEAGLLSGIQMNFRAILVIIGFAVIGKELYNPVVTNFQIPHHHIITSSHHHIITSSHHHIITSSHHHIITSSHHHIITSSH